MSRLCPSRGVHTAANSDGAVILHSGRDRFYGLNPTAAVLWGRLEKGETPEEVANEFAERWGVNVERLLPDVLALVDTLVRLELAVLVEEF